ncbi:helicase C-terminal domain-containing protein [Methylobacterium brachiatum]|uniref:helicase C-terminal domain-containing protein n=1 Tax=Methylobacterium brachiatum TaxID=269660 RepID=UPI003314BA71
MVAEDLPEQTVNAGLTDAVALRIGRTGFVPELRIEVTHTRGNGREITILLVNASPAEHPVLADTRLYETSLEVSGLATLPFVLEALPDSFRYDRAVAAYGVNCGVVVHDGRFLTADVAAAQKTRPRYWGLDEEAPDLRFETLARDPLPSLEALADALSRWGEVAWSSTSLAARATAESWSGEMAAEAALEADAFQVELDRVRTGVRLLGTDGRLYRAFTLMNRALSGSSAGRGYDGWRPFQIGFILSNLPCIVHPETEADVVDIVWFATGGGKTETYLGLLVTAALHDRLTGKTEGVTAWTRFPLRMLSLQQLQRFADAMAAAELVRRSERIGGASFSLGYLVGQSSTPNSIRADATNRFPGEPDPDDEAMPSRFRVLQRCPFCRSEELEMRFDRRLWRLDHCCTTDACPWPEDALPFHVVDDEIYRFLPTVVVGTLDKAATIGMQAAMRGLVGPPLGLCTRPGHGFTYSPRSTRPTGCLVPGCRHVPGPLPMAEDRFGPSYRLQDELHLLRDTLGAVDAHYEALLDGLELELCGRRPKILASSATLEGYETQVDVLYRRAGRVFPLQGPSIREGFWTSQSDEPMRRFVAVAPRGLTIEFALDRMLTELQAAVRDLARDPTRICAEAGVNPDHADFLLSMYGTDVVYGNTLRDLDAVDRSIQGGQVQVEGHLEVESLTGRTDFERVRTVLQRLENPESDFEQRIHVVTASAMMSHGVDVDRLNVMVMVGLPLGTAEFIQATARVGRKHPGIVFVVHKIGRERDAGVFRSFAKFVEQGDRFVEPVPITRKSRRVLERTTAGLAMARILAIHEPRAGGSLATVAALQRYRTAGHLDFDAERTAIANWLGIDPQRDEGLWADLCEWFRDFERNLVQPTPDIRFPSQASPTGSPMMSLRDVEEQVPLFLDSAS